MPREAVRARIDSIIEFADIGQHIDEMLTDLSTQGHGQRRGHLRFDPVDRLGADQRAVRLWFGYAAIPGLDIARRLGPFASTQISRPAEAAQNK